MGGGREWADRRSAAARGDGQGGAGDRRAVCVAGGGEKGSRGLPAGHRRLGVFVLQVGFSGAWGAVCVAGGGEKGSRGLPAGHRRLVVYVLQLDLSGHWGHFGFLAVHTSAPNSITA